MRIRLGFILLQFLMFVLPSTAHRSMGPNEFMALVQKNHPIAIQAKLTLDKANAELMAARGAFDPKANTAFSEKQFNNTTYWNTLDSYLKLPAWIGEFKGGYERSGGKYLNPDDVVDEGGLYYASYTLPMGAGLFFDERRNALKQAKVCVTMSEAEQRAMPVSYNNLTVPTIFRVARHVYAGASTNNPRHIDIQRNPVQHMID